VVTPNLCSLAHTHVFLHTHTHNTYTVMQKTRQMGVEIGSFSIFPFPEKGYDEKMEIFPVSTAKNQPWSWDRFLNQFLGYCLSQLWLWWEEKMIWNKRSDVISILTRRLVFLVGEPKKIAKPSMGLFNHYFSNYLPIVLPRVLGDFLYLLKWWNRGVYIGNEVWGLVWPELWNPS
jgi:hypothetical protein